MKTCDVCKKEKIGALPYWICGDCAHIVSPATKSRLEEEGINGLKIANTMLLVMCKGALSALTQNKTYPADIKLAKAFLLQAISPAGRKE